MRLTQVSPLDRLATELGLPLERDAGRAVLVVDRERVVFDDDLQAVRFLAFSAWWRDDREEIRERVGFEGPVSELLEGPRWDAVRWLAGEGPAVERLPKAQRFVRRADVVKTL